MHSILNSVEFDTEKVKVPLARLLTTKGDFIAEGQNFNINVRVAATAARIARNDFKEQPEPIKTALVEQLFALLESKKVDDDLGYYPAINGHSEISSKFDLSTLLNR